MGLSVDALSRDRLVGVALPDATLLVYRMNAAMSRPFPHISYDGPYCGFDTVQVRNGLKSYRRINAQRPGIVMPPHCQVHQPV